MPGRVCGVSCEGPAAASGPDPPLPDSLPTAAAVSYTNFDHEDRSLTTPLVFQPTYFNLNRLGYYFFQRFKHNHLGYYFLQRTLESHSALSRMVQLPFAGAGTSFG